MDVLSSYCQAEETIKGSRFLSELFPCTSQAQARDLVKQQKTKYASATHVVHAFITGNNAEVMGMSDDGEPGGTAGRPALDVLKGSGCTNLLLTVTRWFGGTLLGTGGLVKAYGNGAKLALTAAREQGLIEPLIEKTPFSFECDYSIYKPLKIKLEEFDIYELKENFGTGIELTGQIKEEQFQNLELLLKNISNGKIELQRL